MERWRFRYRAPTAFSISDARCVSDSEPPATFPIPCPYRDSVGATRIPRFQSHALTGHRIPAQGANPGNTPGKRNTRSEGTPHTPRVSEIDPGPPYAVFLQNTPVLSDAVPRVGTLGWYTLPRWGKWHSDHASMTPSPSRPRTCHPAIPAARPRFLIEAVRAR
jgi:hypothetical protein